MTREHINSLQAGQEFHWEKRWNSLKWRTKDRSDWDPVHTTPHATITAHFGIVFEENSVREITRLLWHGFRKAPFLKRFPSTPKQKVGVFKFLRFEERFRKAPFSWRFSADGKAAFSNSSGVAWALPKLKQEQATFWCLTYRHKFLIRKWFNVRVQKLATKKCDKRK